MSDIWNGIRKKINDGKKCYDKNEMAEALETWILAWEQLKKNVKNAEMPVELCEVDEATDYVYGFEEWLPQIATAYIVLKKWNEAIAFCNEVKEIFAWKNTRPDEYNQTIGMIYNMSGETDKAKEWFVNNEQIFYLVFVVLWITGLAGIIISPAISWITNGFLSIGKIIF